MALETWYKQDIRQPAAFRDFRGSLFSNDSSGNLIGVEVYDGDDPVMLAGSVTGYYILATGETVTSPGLIVNNKAYVIVPASAYAVPGNIIIIIKQTYGTDVTTLLAVSTNVFNSRTDSIITPSEQQITDWTNQIANALSIIQNNTVRYDIAQSLTSQQKTRAKTNIGATWGVVRLPDGDFMAVCP